MIGNDTKFKLYDAKLHTNGRRMADWSETCPFESVEGLLRTSWGILGLPWAPGASCGRLGLWAILEHPGTSWELPGASWSFLGLRGSPGFKLYVVKMHTNETRFKLYDVKMHINDRK